MYATKHLDWLSVTFEDLRSALGIIPDSDWHNVGSGHHGYRTALQDAVSGARIETDSAVASMGAHLTMSGQTLYEVRTQYPDGDNSLVQAIRANDGSVSRVDLALNIHQGELTVQDFFSAYKSGDLKSNARRVYYVEGISDARSGDTLYLGSPKSDRQCRIYNKAAEQAIVDNESWLRLELALRDLRAKNGVNAMGSNTCAAVISAHVEDMLGWDNREFNDALLDVPVALHPIKRRRPNTEQWLLDQCAPALAKVYSVHPDFMVEFMTKFRQSLDKLYKRG